MRMNHCFLYASVLGVGLASVVVAQSAPDVVVKAMQDELARSMKKLQLEKLEKPYFISYTVTDVKAVNVSATFGSLTGNFEEQRARQARVQVRVGDYDFDNRNFFSASSGRAGGRVTLPLDDNYDEIRRQLWLATDASYKKALEDIAKKRAVLANKNRSEVLPDFSKEEPVTMSDVLPEAEAKVSDAERLVRELSGLFKETPEIASSSVRLVLINESRRYVNSEGSSTVSRHPEVELFVATRSQAPDGQPLGAGISFRGRSMSDLPSREEIVRQIRARSKDVAELEKSPLPDRYAGPVLFEGMAACEVLNQQFMRPLVAIPEVVVDNPQNRFTGDRENLVEKIGLRILPDFLSLTDDPTLTMFEDRRLMGVHKFDDEAVVSRRMNLVENGLLMRLLTARAPVPGFPHSSGSMHDGGLTPTNLVMTSSRSMTLEELRSELVRRATLRGKAYGVIVRKVDSSTRGAESAGLAPGSMPVLLAYKRFADGHEELMRNAIVNGINFGSFKDILAVSKEATVWNTFSSPRSLDPSQPAGSSLISMVVPSLLFEDATVQRPTGSVSKPPILEHPYFSKN